VGAVETILVIWGENVQVSKQIEVISVKSTGEVMGVLPQRYPSKNYVNNVKWWVLLMPSGLDRATMW